LGDTDEKRPRTHIHAELGRRWHNHEDIFTRVSTPPHHVDHLDAAAALSEHAPKNLREIDAEHDLRLRKRRWSFRISVASSWLNRRMCGAIFANSNREIVTGDGTSWCHMASNMAPFFSGCNGMGVDTAGRISK
jgi:hypothetical protein